MNPRGEHMKTILIRGLAIVGFVAILFAGLWGTVQVVKLMPKIFSNLAAVTTFTSIFVPNEKITINTPLSLVPSDDVFELTWEHAGKPKDGTYTFNYACRDGFVFQTPNEEGVYETVACNSPFSFASDTNSLLFIPLSQVNRFVDIPIVITSINEDGESTTLDDGFLTIVNEAVSGSLLTPSVTTDTTATTLIAGEQVDEIFPISDSRSISVPNGRVDLKVRIIDTGIIDANNTFVATSTIKFNEQGAVRFSITNIGTKTSDNWTFNAVLPTFPMHIFHSENQRALAPGDRIDFTLGFNQLNGSLTEGVITINADPTGRIYNELNRDNNIAQVTIQITQ